MFEATPEGLLQCLAVERTEHDTPTQNFAHPSFDLLVHGGIAHPLPRLGLSHTKAAAVRPKFEPTPRIGQEFDEKLALHLHALDFDRRGGGQGQVDQALAVVEDALGHRHFGVQLVDFYFVHVGQDRTEDFGGQVPPNFCAYVCEYCNLGSILNIGSLFLSICIRI